MKLRIHLSENEEIYISLTIFKWVRNYDSTKITRERSKVIWDLKYVMLVQDTKELTFHRHYKSGFLFSDEQLPYDDAWREKQERYTVNCTLVINSDPYKGLLSFPAMQSDWKFEDIHFKY